MPSFRLTLFLLALPAFGFAQQFPVNSQKIVQGTGTTAQGITSYSSAPPSVNPTTTTWRHVTSIHMDTVAQINYLYKRPRWYPISTVRRSTPPPATSTSGGVTIDYTESLWQNTTDSLTYYYEEEVDCWQPIGTYISTSTPVDVAATGSTGAVCYGYGLWYDPDVDSIYAQQGSTWTAIGAGGPVYEDWTAVADTGTPAVISDGETVTFAGGYGVNTAISGNTITATADTSQVATPYDLSILSDSIAAAPSGTGTNLRIPVWTGANSLGSSTLLQSATGQTLDANLAFRITGGLTASRPTGAAGMQYWNTSNGWLDIHNGTAWFNPLRSTTTTGLGTAGRVFYADASGLAAADDVLYWDATNNELGVGVNPSFPLDVQMGSNRRIFFTNGGGGNAPGLTIATLTGTGKSVALATGTLGSVFITDDTGNFYITRDSKANIDAGTSSGGTVSVTVTNTPSMGINTATPDRTLHSELSGSATNTVGLPLRLSHITSGTATTGFGVGWELEAENASGTNRVIGQEEAVYTTATNAAEVSDLVFRTMRAGTLTESLRSLGNGTLQISTLSGTGTKIGGYTSGNIATELSQGYGINVTSGALEVDTTQVATQSDVNAAWLKPQLEAGNDVNIIGTGTNQFTIDNIDDISLNATTISLDAAGSFVSLTSDTYVEMASNAVGGWVGISTDSLVLTGNYPTGTASDSVLVRDAATGRVKLYAGNEVGTWLKPELEATDVDIDAQGNILSITDSGTGSDMEISTDGVYQVGTGLDLQIGSASGSLLMDGDFAQILNNSTSLAGKFRIREGTVNGGNYIEITTPASITANEVFSFRNTDGTTGQTIVTGISPVTATLDFGNTAAGAVSDLTVTVTGAAVGDLVTIGVPNGSVPAGGTYFAWVSATNTVTVRFANNNLTTSYDPASGSFKVRVDK